MFIIPIFSQAEQREKVEKENAQTLADEVDRIKMEIEQEKADLKVTLFPLPTPLLLIRIIQRVILCPPFTG